VYFKQILFRCPVYENIKRLLFVAFSFYDGDYSFKFYLIFWAWELFIKNNTYSVDTNLSYSYILLLMTN